MGHPERKKLWKYAIHIGISIAFIRALFLTRIMRQLQIIGPDIASFFLSYFFIITGALVIFVAVEIVQRRGLGNGFSVVIGIFIIKDIARSFQPRSNHKTMGPEVIIVTAILIATLLLLWNKDHHGDQPPYLPTPACGIQPWILFGSFSSIAITQAIPDLAFGNSSTITNIVDKTYIHYVLLFAGVVLFTLFYHGPTRIKKIWQRMTISEIPSPKQIQRGFLRAIGKGAGFMALLCVLQALLWRTPETFLLLSMTLLTAIGADLYKEWRFRIQHKELASIWPLHRLYTVEPTLKALEATGISAHVKGLHHRTLLGFFGPMAPMDLLVPAQDRAVAHQIVGALLSPEMA